MDPEIDAIVADMQKYDRGGIGDADRHDHLVIQMGRLLALLAKESEKQTRKMICFTKAVVALTIVLIILGFIPIIIAIFG